MRRRVLQAGGLLGLAGAMVGCANPLANTSPRFDYFVIQDLATATPPAPRAPAAPRIDRTVLLALGTTQSLFDSDRMVFSRDGTGHAYYQFSSWSERPARRLIALAEARLARSGAFRSVGQATSGIRGDLLLTLRLEDFTHDARPPGQVRVQVVVDLVDWSTRRLVERRTFVQTAPTATNDARGAAAAANVATTALLDEMALWLSEVASRA